MSGRDIAVAVRPRLSLTWSQPQYGAGERAEESAKPVRPHDQYVQVAPLVRVTVLPVVVEVGGFSVEPAV